MTGDKSVNANFVSFKPTGKVALDKKKGTGALKVSLGGAGTVAVSGKTINSQPKTSTKAGTVFTPTGGATASSTVKFTLRKQVKP